jgi:hypothetical protein
MKEGAWYFLPTQSQNLGQQSINTQKAINLNLFNQYRYNFIKAFKQPINYEDKYIFQNNHLVYFIYFW